MKFQRPWASALLLLTCITITLTFHHHIASFYVKHAIDSELEFLLEKLETHVGEAIDMNEQFMRDLTFDCSASDITKMQRAAFTSPHVRLFEIHTQSGKQCSSHGRAVEQSEEDSWHTLKDNVFIGSELNNITHTHDLAVINTAPNYKLIADIEPIHIPRAFCDECAVLKVQLNNLDILVSDIDSQTNDLALSSFIYSDKYPFSLSLSVSKNYLSPVEHWSGAISLGIGATLGLLLVFAMQWLLSQNQTMEALIKQGLQAHEFKPYYQPILHSKSGKIVGCEVLVRWVKEDGTVIPPYQFIPFAEDSGLIIPITEQLLYRVVRDIKKLNWADTDKFMSVNIVPEHLYSNDLYDYILSLKTDDSWSFNNLSLEITERRKIEDLQQAKVTLSKFYEMGIELKLDDAGTGYGGFSYVQELGISTIKIDKMFVDVIGTDDMKSSVLSSIIAFAEASSKKTIAEGVETNEQVEYLAKHGVYKIQGYVYAKPMPFNELVEWKKVAKNLITMKHS
ncbi:EAL domain-containing protein [Pseudoalteromonas sp. MMG013]|uniref:EAL domain-containing protein n=1 Tax=Pseudoalteromonas sp. MMG013 TaxID=2822687 RepID=UPI001B35EB35|nr:EAL domain-containing protein [Pseudoalteromonas sp. MMG013]MBQ4861542.1 EAL domain-containing protein [Pseudoalteromonas sp. MMG013]